MEVVFHTRQLRRCYEESGRATQSWGPEVGRSYIRRIKMLYALKDFQEAYHRPALHLHPLRSSHRGELSIYLNGRWRLIVTKGDEQTVNIEEVSNHYDD